jgi:hypothetical protein
MLSYESINGLAMNYSCTLEKGLRQNGAQLRYVRLRWEFVSARSERLAVQQPTALSTYLSPILVAP